MTITGVTARQILDSRGNPTVEADVLLENGVLGRAAVPSGASTGTYEAVELRDDDKKIYNGKSVLKAVNNVKKDIAKAIIGEDVLDQQEIDSTLIELDGTPNKSRLGANAILAVSLATAKAAAIASNKPLFTYFSELSKRSTEYLLPVPLMNIINGGKHAAGSTDIQEFMILPVSMPTFSEALRAGAEIFHSLGKVLESKGYSTTVGDEGGYAPHVKAGNKEALDLILEAIKKAGYIAGKDVVLGLDVAASELFKDGSYHLSTEKKTLSTKEMAQWYSELVKNYPIYSIEDGFSESDWEGFHQLTTHIGKNKQIVGDDLFVTNIQFLERGIKEQSANAVLVKLNQIGTLTETLNCIQMATEAGWSSIISHRSGETEDTTIAHLAVGLATGQIKTGSLCRTDRVAKYNELLRIEETLGKKAKFAGKSIFQK